jgi:site-specific recombinase XerD
MPRSVWGQVYYRKDTNKWCVRVPSGETESGRTSYTCLTVGSGHKAKARAGRILAKAHKQHIIERLAPTKDTPGRVTVLEAVGAYIDSVDISPRTVVSYRQTLRHLGSHRLGKMPVKAVTFEDVEAWLHDLPLARGTKRVHFAVISASFKRLVRTGTMAENPADRVKRIKPTRAAKAIFRPDEIERLRAVCEGDILVVLVLGLYTGARTSEIQTIRWGDVDLAARTVLIRRAKTSNASTIRLHQEVVRVLQAHRAAGGRVPQSRDLVVEIVGVWSVFRRRLDHAGITRPGISPHSMRHTFATYFVVRGGNLRSLQGILGHASLSTTERYVRDLPELADTEIDALDFTAVERTGSVPAESAHA